MAVLVRRGSLFLLALFCFSRVSFPGLSGSVFRVFVIPENTVPAADKFFGRSRMDSVAGHDSLHFSIQMFHLFTHPTVAQRWLRFPNVVSFGKVLHPLRRTL